jgi:hypothetical protein
MIAVKKGDRAVVVVDGSKTAEVVVDTVLPREGNFYGIRKILDVRGNPLTVETLFRNSNVVGFVAA